MNSALMLIGALLLACGLCGGWFCYSKVSPDKVDEASYELAHGVIPTESVWLVGSIIGLLAMVAGMVLMFVAIVGINSITPWIAWFKEVFG